MLRHVYILFILVLSFASAHAGTRYAGASMELGIGARPLALAGASAGMTGNGETFYYNPASLSFLQKPGVNLMYAPTFGSLRSPMAHFNYIGLAYPLPGGGTIAVNWTRFSVDDIPLFPDLKGTSYADRNNDITMRPSGEPLGYFEDTEDVYYFSFAKSISTTLPLGWLYIDLPLEIPFGLNFKLLRNKLGNHSASGMGIDLGTMVRFNLGTFLDNRHFGDLTLGYAITDITRTSVIWDTQHQDKIARTSRFGLAYQQQLGFKDALFNLYWTRYSKYESMNLVGLEFAMQGLAVRIGRNAAGMTAGAGVMIWKLQIDYAFIANTFQDVHRLSCAFTL